MDAALNDSLLSSLMALDAEQPTCWHLVPWMDYSRLMLTVGLAGVDMLVVFGNMLVIIAVITHRSLHTTTNFIIMSLATSDFLLGVFVLPFSISQEMLVQVWPFGTWLCRMWLAIDVWMCTASIYNLVAISFDRFMAVTQPLRYKLISSARMGRLLVALAWIVSFMICLPPLVVPVIMDQLRSGGSDVPEMPSEPVDIPIDNRSLFMLEFLHSCSCSPMNNDDIYVIYSAMGSFIVPWAMIIGLNIGIYYTALRSGMAMKNGYKKYSRSRATSSTSLRPNEPVVLRVHRGGCYAELTQPPRRADTEPHKFRRILRRLSVPSPTQLDNLHSTPLSTPTNYAPSLSTTPSPGGDYLMPTTSIASRSRRTTLSSLFRRKSMAQNLTASPREIPQLVAVEAAPAPQQSSGTPYATDTQQYPFREHPSPIISPPRDANSNVDRLAQLIAKSARKSSETSLLNGGLPHASASLSSHSPANTQQEIRATITSRARRRAERAETRVAKTIGVVVGCFTVCWLPFTVIYIMQAYDICTLRSGCVPKWLFTITFWMGYSNSAFNPLIYALFSRDFRRAFKRVLSKLTLGCGAPRSAGLQAVATKANSKILNKSVVNNGNGRSVGQRVPLIAVNSHATEADILLGDSYA